MNTASWIAFRTVLERSEKKEELLAYLSDEEREHLTKTPLPSQDPFKVWVSLEERLKGIHYSWLIPLIEPFSERDKIILLSTLDPSQGQKLMKYFKVEEYPKDLPSPVKHYVQQTIYQWLLPAEYLPIEFLPSHPLIPLLALSKTELQSIIDFLGLHDLATEMKQVIQSEKIKKIQKVLSREEQNYLKELLTKRKQVSFARLNLDQWDGTAKTLKKILHHRGLNRLAKALFGCHPSFLWHITHRFDTGRAKMVKKFFTDINNDKAQETLKGQILELISFISTK